MTRSTLISSHRLRRSSRPGSPSRPEACARPERHSPLGAHVRNGRRDAERRRPIRRKPAHLTVEVELDAAPLAATPLSPLVEPNMHPQAGASLPHVVCETFGRFRRRFGRWTRNPDVVDEQDVALLPEHPLQLQFVGA